VGRTWHGGLLFESEDYRQVAAMRFSLLAQPPTSAPREVWRALRRRPLRKGGDSA
jgi:hypothetical protein